MSFLIYMSIFVVLSLFTGIYCGIHFENRELDRLWAAIKRQDEILEQTQFLAGRKNP